MYLYTCDYLKSRISTALAGVIAEELIFGNRSTGGSGDFKHASDIAKQIVFSGMSELGIISSEDIPGDQLHSAVTSILRDVEGSTRELLSKYGRTLKQITELLLDKETISGEELRFILNTGRSECA